MSTEAQKKASANYAKKMTKCVNLAFNKKTDADILEKLDHVESKMGYIKKLIIKVELDFFEIISTYPTRWNASPTVTNFLDCHFSAFVLYI